MATASLPSSQSTVPSPECTLPPSLPEPKPVSSIYWLDWYCLLFWLVCAAILIGLHLTDGLSRLLRLF